MINGKTAAACTREPAYVIGNAINDIGTLIKIRQMITEAQNPSNQLIVQENSLPSLNGKNVNFRHIPINNEKIILSNLSNMYQVAINNDVTKEIHALYQTWVSQLSNYYQSSYFAIDIITDDVSNDPNKHANIIEINSKPIWVHHTFSELRQHNMAENILVELHRITK